MTKKPLMPKDFGIRWLLWAAYTNAITIIMTMQLVFLYLSSDPDSGLSPHSAHHVLIVSNVLGIVVAQIKRNNPPGPRPLKKKVIHG